MENRPKKVYCPSQPQKMTNFDFSAGLPTWLHPTLRLPTFAVAIAFRQLYGCWDSSRITLDSLLCSLNTDWSIKLLLL